jgi:uncharacterized protein (DUF488 family)
MAFSNTFKLDNLRPGASRIQGRDPRIATFLRTIPKCRAAKPGRSIVPDQTSPCVATIGYERSPLPDVIARLQAAEVALLIDVRAIAASRRPGFSKTLLSGSLAAAGVDYLHLRDLGTPKAGRIAARAGRTAEMAHIFDTHLQTAAAQGALAQAVELSLGRRVCLLCYEADPACCHRAIVAAQIRARTGATVIDL